MPSGVYLVLLVAFSVYALEESEYCFGGTDWICLPIEDCRWALRAQSQGQFPRTCNKNETHVVVCCPKGVDTSQDQDTSDVPDPLYNSISQKKCREYAQLVPLEHARCRRRKTRIFRGDVADRAEFPHMVSLGYGETVNVAQWLCGGTLISERFVLSAAYCNENLSTKPVWVWLGANYASGDPSIQISIKIGNRYIHPSYNKVDRYNNIALFELESEVAFSDFIRPICLPDSRPFPNRMSVTGWGRTEWDSRVVTIDLRKLTLSYIDPTECNNTFKAVAHRKELPFGIDEETQLCAGEEGRNTCQEDEGGPLQAVIRRPYCIYMQFGITSYGNTCGLADIPTIFTRVSHYLPWIEGIVWKN